MLWHSAQSLQDAIEMVRASKQARLRTFERELEARVRLAVVELRRLVGTERLYAFALFTSHEDEYLYVLASANTEEALERRIEESARRDPSADLPGLRRRLRWSAPDWGYAFIERLNALPAANRRTRWLELYEALALGVEAAADSLLSGARGVGLSQYEANEQVRALGAEVAPDLVRLLQRLARAQAFNQPGTAANQRDGAFTREANLAADAAFLIGEIGGVGNHEIETLQAIVAEVEARDRGLPLASTLAENVARVLHGLRPRRFPETVMDPRSNHLRNAEAFIRS